MPSSFGIGRRASSSASALAQFLRDAVVEVRCGAAGGDAGAGTGIVWGGAGLIVTNAHCVARDAAIAIRSGNRTSDATLIALHRGHDLALLAAPAVRGPMLEARDPLSLRSGELVFAHGHPLGVQDALAMGVLHAVVPDARSGEPRWIVADVRLAPGNSGGPLVDAEGRLLGVNSMVVNGLGLAVPTPLVQRLVDHALSRRAA